MKKKVALITGGAHGMGLAFAKRLSMDGFRVAIWDIHNASNVADELGEAAAFEVDLRDELSIQSGTDATLEQFGQVDVVVNNAGIYPNVPFEDIDLAEWRRVMSLNLEAPFLVCRAFAAGMRARGFGRIINISSNTVGLKIPGFVHYISSKMGIIGLTRGLASELGADGVTVNCVLPGLTKTDGMMHPDRRGPGGVTFEQEVELLTTLQAIPRGETVDDLTGAVAFFASDAAGFITGQSLVVDGGLIRL